MTRLASHAAYRQRMARSSFVDTVQSHPGPTTSPQHSLRSRLRLLATQIFSLLIWASFHQLRRSYQRGLPDPLLVGSAGTCKRSLPPTMSIPIRQVSMGRTRSLVQAVYTPHMTSPAEIATVCGAVWPLYVSPILNDWQAACDQGEDYKIPLGAPGRLASMWRGNITPAGHAIYPHNMPGRGRTNRSFRSTPITLQPTGC